MLPHQQRVVDESNDLKVKIDALALFLNGAASAGLGTAERGRLKRQYTYMSEYWVVLQERISAFAN